MLGEEDGKDEPLFFEIIRAIGKIISAIGKRVFHYVSTNY